MNIRSRLFLSAALFLAGCISSDASGPSDQWATWQYTPPEYQSHTSCLIEIRDGKKSCWGIVIDFDDAHLRKTISPQQLRISEAKHGTNLIKLMTWDVSHDGKRLTIKFKPGTGDFGAGNRAKITLYKTSFIVPPKNFPNHAVFVQGTDPN